MITFDGPNKLVYLDPAQLIYTDVELYSAWVEWVHSGEGAKYYPAFVQSDAVVLPSGALAPSYTLLQNQKGWRIMLPENDLEYTVNGNVIPDDGSLKTFLKPVGFSPNLQINTSSIAVVQSAANVTVEGGGLTTQEAADLAALRIEVKLLHRLAGLERGKPVTIPAGAGTIQTDDIQIDVTGDCENGHTLTRQ